MYIGCEKFMFGLWMWKIFHAWSEYISELLSELKAVEQDTKPTILISRRMDYVLAISFLVIVTTPTLYLFFVCFSMDNTIQEKELLEGSQESMLRL
ncbi:unnamed protein product [Heligmosomoides polygyrus]|uniref:G_PROTEIN_RECEP_F1_2 domain-containing protein n=1 Tax=Heligmosomoides polygyrus TaxID=6339 RepID=A0A183GMD8_HELPZ|nr:unnamed protein product [Heligmosomoides polygyrus]